VTKTARVQRYNEIYSSRLSCANSTENIRKALARMGEFLSTRKAA
jgi:hypothetical protein